MRGQLLELSFCLTGPGALKIVVVLAKKLGWREKKRPPGVLDHGREEATNRFTAADLRGC